MTEKHLFERGEQGKGFEKAWRAKLSLALDRSVGVGNRRKVMTGVDELSGISSDLGIVSWTCEVLGRIEALVGEDKGNELLAQCACEYPKLRLEPLKTTYQETHDIKLVHGMLQQQFLENTMEFLRLDSSQLDDIVKRGWGVAGVIEANTIVATKMPFEFHEYFQAQTPDEKRFRYCHCQRVRQLILEGKESMPSMYCYCGAGFYKSIWEYILQREVKVQVLESVLQGDPLCRIVIHPLDS